MSKKMIRFLMLVSLILLWGCTKNSGVIGSPSLNNLSYSSGNDVLTSPMNEKEKGMADDRRRYEAWCKQHPGKCSTTLKMFED